MMRSHFAGKVEADGERHNPGWGRPNRGRHVLRRAWRSAWRRLLDCAAAALAGGILLLGQVAEPAQALKSPAGMVPYAYPVYHNGRRMLWHGAWRGRAGHEYARTAPARAAIAATATPQSQGQAAASPPQSSPAPPLKPFTILADPADLTASRMANDFVAVLNAKGAAGRSIVGSTSPAGLAKVARADMADLAIVTFDSLAASAKADPEWPKRAPLIARLAPETIQIIAPRGVKTVRDLQGKSVSLGDLDSATATSANLLFSRLGISINPAYEPMKEAIDGLSSGSRAAVVVLGAKDAKAVIGLSDDGAYHVVAIPWTAALEQDYAPARLAPAAHPDLVAANSTIETVAEPVALIALDAPAGSPRAEAVGRLTRVFFDSYDAFASDDRDSHWRDVNLAADSSVAGLSWPRLPAAQEWLDQRKSTADASLDAFRASAQSAAYASGGPKPEDSDRLYDDLTRWRSLTQ